MIEQCNNNNNPGRNSCQLPKGHTGAHFDDPFYWTDQETDLHVLDRKLGMAVPLPIGVSGLSPDMAYFATQMAGRIKVNTIAEDTPLPLLVSLMMDHVEGLGLLIQDGGPVGSNDRVGWTSKVTQEATDIANLCMVIAVRVLDMWIAPVVKDQVDRMRKGYQDADNPASHSDL